MKEYAVKSGRTVLDDNIFKNRKKAEEYLASLKAADRVYDIPYETKRVIVEREVTAWKTSKTALSGKMTRRTKNGEDAVY